MLAKTGLIAVVIFTYSFLPCRAQVHNPPDSVSTDTTAIDSTSQKQKEELKEFRNAFNKLVKSGEKKRKIKKKADQDPTLQLGILVLDKTRTKMGRDFYNLFYQNWESPVGDQNFTITISEKPSPGLGSIVSINIDNDLVYRARLQPRYTAIKRASAQAINRCRTIIKRNFFSQLFLKKSIFQSAEAG